MSLLHRTLETLHSLCTMERDQVSLLSADCWQIPAPAHPMHNHPRMERVKRKSVDDTRSLDLPGLVRPPGFWTLLDSLLRQLAGASTNHPPTR